MALQKDMTLTDNFGEDITLNNAYIRVDFVRSDKLTALARVGVYNSEMRKYETRSVPFTPTYASGSENHVKQAYAYLKTLSEYSEATDV